MEREVKPFSKPWKLVERAESFEVQDSASRRTLAFVYFSDDPWRCVFNRYRHEAPTSRSRD
jgi:hypothetical protein